MSIGSVCTPGDRHLIEAGDESEDERGENAIADVRQHHPKKRAEPAGA
jgi:hypothetical protein